MLILSKCYKRQSASMWYLKCTLQHIQLTTYHFTCLYLLHPIINILYIYIRVYLYACICTQYTRTPCSYLTTLIFLNTAEMTKQKQQSSLLIFTLIAGLFFQTLLIPVISTPTPEQDQKTYYHNPPASHAGTHPPTGRVFFPHILHFLFLLIHMHVQWSIAVKISHIHTLFTSV